MTSPIADAANPPIILAARNLTLALGQGGAAVAILKGIDLAVPQGQTVALLGPSGSGKSSLMAVLTGLERASSGTLAVAGADFIGMDEDALARQYHDALVPFFLSAVIDRPDLRLPDHIHPTPAGVQALVAATRGTVMKALRAA